MERIYRVLLIAVVAVGILFGLQYFLPITAQYLNIKGFSGIPGLPSMPTIAYQATVEPLPLATLQPQTFSTPQAVFITPLAIPGGATTTITAQPGATTEVSASPSVTSTTRAGTTAIRPAPTATRTATATTVQTGQNSGLPCDNVLFPARLGQSWTYQATNSQYSQSVNMVVSAVSGPQARLDISNPSTGLFKETLIACNNGAILSMPSIFFDNILGKLDVQYVSGVFAPSLSTLQSKNWDYSWQSSYRLNGQASAPFQGMTVNVAFHDSPLTMSCRTSGAGNAAFERVSVPAGTAQQALKVICTVETPITSNINGFPISGTVTGQTTMWFGLNIGLLKLQVDSANINAVGLSVSIPNANGQITLTHFEPAP
jgi:hypothetical protein